MYELTESAKRMIESVTKKEHDGTDMLPFLGFLAEKVFKRPVTVYDLETSSFLGTPNFGVTEVAMLHVVPGDGLYSTTSLCNPCHPISKGASEKTGITDEMVRNAPRWEEFGGPLFNELTEAGHIFIGFNNFTFDRNCVVEANKRSGFKGITPSLEQELDVIRAATLFTGTGKAPKLGSIGQALGVMPQNGELHRALTDVYVTAGVADRLGYEYGLDTLRNRTLRTVQSTGNVTEFPQPPSTDLFDVVRVFVENSRGPVMVGDLEEHVKKNCTDARTVRNPSFFIGECIDCGRIRLTSLGFDEEKVARAMTVLAGDGGIIRAWSNPGNDRKLKPLFDVVRPFVKDFDYITLREALTRMGVRWATLKVEPEDLLDPGNQQTAHRYPFLNTEEDTVLNSISL